MEQSRSQPPQREVVRIILVFYSAMALVGLAAVWLRAGEWNDVEPLALVAPGWPLHLLVTIILALAVHIGTRWAARRFQSVRQTGRDLKSFLGHLSPSAIAIAAVASGVGEELFFRAWLLNEIGLILSSFIFGMVHIPPSRKWLYWPVFATAMGFALGWLYTWSCSILFPIMLHAGINYLNLRFMMPGCAAPAETNDRERSDAYESH